MPDDTRRMSAGDHNAAGSPARMIEVRRLAKRFGKVEVLRGIDLAVSASEVICIIGPSGAGKSTLLRCIAFLEIYDEGEVRIEGRLLGYRERDGRRVLASEREVDEVRSSVGMVFQHFNLWPHMTALGNVTEALRMVRRMSGPTPRQAASRCCAGSVSRPMRVTIRSSFPAVRSSAWRSPGRWR